MIDYAAGSSDYDFNSVSQRAQLVYYRGAAVYGRGSRIGLGAQRFDFACDLHGELAGRNEDKGAGAVLVGAEFLYKGDAESGRFSGSGAGLRDYVRVSVQ